MLKIEYQGQFKRDYKKAVKRGLNVRLLQEVIEILASENKLHSEYKDHALKNSKQYKGVRECHIQDDWLLIYKIYKDRLILELMRTGTHSDLF